MLTIYPSEFGCDLSIKEVQPTIPSNNGVAIEVEATSPSSSDLNSWMGHDGDVVPPLVTGHEHSGSILAKGARVLSIFQRSSYGFFRKLV